MKNRRIEFVISQELLKLLDDEAAANYTSRSNFIRECIVLRLQGNSQVKREKDEFLERLKQYEQEV